MAFTLRDMAVQSSDSFERGVVKRFVDTSDLLDVLDVEVVPDHDDTELSGARADDDEHQAEEPGRETLGDAPMALPGGKPGYLDTETALSQARAANAKRHESQRR